MIKFKKRISIFTGMLLTMALLGNANYTHVNAESIQPNYKSSVNSIRNISINQTKGKLLNINSKIVNENGKMYKITEDGQEVSAKISIKDSHITGNLIDNGTEYLLNGFLDEINEKYTGTITNLKEYTFDAYITDVSKGHMLINIFDQDQKPKSYVISDKKAITETELVQDSSPQTLQRSNSLGIQSSTVSPMAIDYFQPFISVAARGIYYSIQGPATNVTPGTWQHSINVRTYADDAWADSGINNYIHYGAFVIKNSIKFSPSDTGSNYTPVYPSSSGSTTFTVPFYFASIVGTQLIPIKTSSTTVTPSGNSLTDSFSWTPAIGYLDEAYSSYTSGKKSFGAQVNWSTNNKGTRTNNITVTLQYQVIGKNSEFSPNVYAYPSYTNSSSYNVIVN